MRLIDAEAFKKQLEESYEYTELSEVVEMLDNAPTVESDYEWGYSEGVHDTERPQGEWIERTEKITLDTYYECSNCKEPWTTIEGTPWDNGMNFCPNCGARMKGGAE